MTVCCEASQQSNLLQRRFFPTEQMLTEQLNTCAQELRVLNIYRNYLSTTQENQVSRSALSRIKAAISDSALSSESSSKRKSSTCYTFAFFGELSFSLDLCFNIVKGSSSNTLLIVQYFKFELCSYQFNHFVWFNIVKPTS